MIIQSNIYQQIALYIDQLENSCENTISKNKLQQKTSLKDEEKLDSLERKLTTTSDFNNTSRCSTIQTSSVSISKKTASNLSSNSKGNTSLSLTSNELIYDSTSNSLNKNTTNSQKQNHIPEFQNSKKCQGIIIEEEKEN